jgi:hypothetical protein
MMSFLDLFRKTKKNLSARVESVLEYGPAINPLTVRREIHDQMLLKIIVDANGKSLPFGRVVIRLRPQTARQHAAFEEAFVREDVLKKYLLQTLNDMQVQYPKEFHVHTELQEPAGPEGASPRSLFEIDFIRLNVVRLEEVPEVRLLITQGSAEQPAYSMKKDRILIGRPAEVLDREGRIVRKNDIIFLETEDEIAASVGSAHARIWYDFEKRGFWIMDEGSRYGTRIKRGRAVIEAPGGDPAGIQLQTGDDLYFGQAALRFELASIIR